MTKEPSISETLPTRTDYFPPLEPRRKLSVKTRFHRFKLKPKKKKKK